jgi:hypothetical protein
MGGEGGGQHRSTFIESSRTNVDDRLPADSPGRIQSGDGVVKARDVADIRP